MCPLRHQTTDGINAICCRIKHNRAKPMFESASAIFSIADAGEFRFARFYIVYEEVPLGTPESPLIVCGLSDTLRECPNVEETRNPMQISVRKKCSHFFTKNLPYAFPSEICKMYFSNYYLSLKGHSELIAKDPFCAGAAFKRVFSGRQ